MYFYALSKVLYWFGYSFLSASSFTFFFYFFRQFIPVTGKQTDYVSSIHLSKVVIKSMFQVK